VKDPKLVIVMETELWPNMVAALHKRKIPLVIANARLSERSAKGYAADRRDEHLYRRQTSRALSRLASWW
jgi:3-deoxy-D-manno-octulosonic-acid transferase